MAKDPKTQMVQSIIKAATDAFKKEQGRPPNNLENILLKQKAINSYLEKQKVVDFPQDKITPFYQDRPTAGIMQASKVNRPSKVIDNERTKKMFEDANRRLMDRQGYRVIPADTPEGRNISKLLGIETEKTNPRFIDYTIQNIKKMDIEDAKKEGMKIIKREGSYDSLSKAEARQILDAIEERIFPEFKRNKTTFSPEDYKPTSNPSKNEIRKLENQLGNLDPNASGFRERANELISKIENLKNKQKGIAGTGAMRQAYDEAIAKGTFKGTYDDFLDYIDNLVDNDFATGGRVGFKKGTDLLRRQFLKLLGAGAATIGAAKTGILKLGAEKKVAKELVSTPPVAGKPAWFDSLVNKVIQEGDDVTKNFAYKDRQIVHQKKIDDETTITVMQDLDDEMITVDIDDPVRNVMGEQGDTSIMLRFKKGQADETTKGQKPPDEFDATEADMRNYMDGPDDYTTEFTDNTVTDVKDLTSDLTKVKSYATGKNPTMKEIAESKRRRDAVKFAEDSPAEYAAERGPQADVGDEDIELYTGKYASGGIAGMLGE